MANNTKYLIEKFGYKKKDVADYLGISMQSLSAMLNIRNNPKKYCEKLGEYLKIEPKYLVKELDEEDERNIILQHYGITSTGDFKENIEILDTDVELTVENFIAFINDRIHRQIDSLHITTITKNMTFPIIFYKKAEIRIKNNDIWFRNIITGERMIFSINIIEKVIKRTDELNFKYFIVQLKNSLTLEIAINYIAVYGEENYQ